MNKFSGIGRVLGLYGLPALGTLAFGSWLLNRTRQPPSVAIDANYGLRADNPNITLSGNTVFHRPNEQSDFRQLMETYTPEERETLFRQGRMRYNHVWGYNPNESVTSDRNQTAFDLDVHGRRTAMIDNLAEKMKESTQSK